METPSTAAPKQAKSAAAVAVAATIAAPQAEPAVARKVQPIEEGRIKGGDFVRAFYVATAFENTEPTDLADQAYWAHIAYKLRIRDRVEVWANDGSWVADVVVLGATKNAADVRVLRVDYIDPIKPPGDADDSLKSYAVRYRGIHSQWSVVRIADGAIVHEGDGSRGAAETWLSNHLKAFK